METSLLKINGEYVKFYVTTNSSLPKILKNTGAIIVYHDVNGTKSFYSYFEGDSINLNTPTNQLWLGNEFISTGYGFSSQAARDAVEEFATIRDDGASKLSYEFTYMHNAYAGAINYSDYLYQKVQESFLTKTGNITNTTINVNGVEIPSAMLSYLLFPAEYDDMVINNLTAYINYGVISYAGDEVQNITKECTITDNGVMVDVPVGADISYISFNFNTTNNDTNGFSYLTTSYNKNTCNEDINTVTVGYARSEVLSNIVANAQTTYYAETIIYNVEPSFTVRYGENKLLNYCYAECTGTQADSYKYYPLLHEQGYDVISTENCIQPYIHEFTPFVINGKYTASTLSTNDITNIRWNSDFRQNAVDVLVDDCTMITVNANNTYELIQLPANKTIKYAYYTYNNIDVNCTGEIFKYETAGLNREKYTAIVAYNSSTKIDGNVANYKNYIYTDIYCLYFRNAFENDMNVYLTIADTDVDEIASGPVQSTTYGIHDTVETSTIKFSSDFVQNEEYNGLHWFKPIDLSYIYF